MSELQPNRGLYSALCRITNDDVFCKLAGKQPVSAPQPPAAAPPTAKPKAPPVKAASLEQDNFNGLLKKGMGLGSPSGLKTDVAKNGQFLSNKSYSVTRVVETWNALTGNPLQGASNREKIRDLQGILNESRASRKLPPLTKDGLLGPQTLWAVHEEMNAQREGIYKQAKVWEQYPETVKQADLAARKNQLHNSIQISRAVTPPGTEIAKRDETYAILNKFDARLK